MKRDQGVTKWDLALIAGIVVFSACWWLYGLGAGREPATVQVISGSRIFAESPADRDAFIRVPGPLGVSVVEIRSGRVRMVSSPCPDKLCVNMGSIGSPGQSLLCIPNRVSVTLRAKREQIDAVTY
jgi:hypothetical protein